MISNVVDKLLLANPSWHGLNEYLLVVTPCPDVYDRVVKEKQIFYNNYDARIAIKTKPHITVANFLAEEAMESTVCTYLQRISNLQPHFTVGLKNFKGFSASTIYINVQNPQPFKQLAFGLQPVRRFITTRNYPIKLVTTPHMTIARRLDPSTYYSAIREYKGRSFTATFQATELVLLRRWSQYHTCQTIATFPLSTQPYLFN